jgi:DNA-binding transcriptional LysR family regulator
MLHKGVTLRGLEVFESLAATGSVAQAAALTGLSQPAVSQQLRNLETALGTELVDHARRPMRLTPAGRSFLARTEAALAQLRQAQSELTVMDLSHLSKLSVGMIDDFDNDLTPRLATALADSMTRCRFKLITASSNDISAALAEGALHIAIAASTGEAHAGIREIPLARDPFILVAPRGIVTTPAAPMSQLSGLPFLRYARDQLISRQIETHLSRQKLSFEERFEIGSHPALMAMVARRIGWAITTPLGHMRTSRFHDDLEAFALPFGAFARRISLFAGTDWHDQLPRDVAHIARQLVQSSMIDPAIAKLPWLAGQLRILQEPE